LGKRYRDAGHGAELYRAVETGGGSSGGEVGKGRLRKTAQPESLGADLLGERRVVIRRGSRVYGANRGFEGVSVAACMELGDGKAG
jgi:hypothetical protein